MTSTSKKLFAALLAVMAAVCLSFGLLFSVPKAASAETSGTVTLSDAEYFNISGNVLSGLSTAGKAEAGTNNIIIEIPEGVTSVAAGTSSAGILGEYTAKLVGLKISASVASIGDYAFYGCSALEDLDTSGAAALTTIGANAFNSGVTSSMGTTALRTVTVPAGVTSVGNKAFANHTNLTGINFYATACADFVSGENNPFYRAGSRNSAESLTLTVNIGQSGGSAVTKIPANMFYVGGIDIKIDYVNFENVNTSGTGSFGENAFRGNTSLRAVNFSDSCIIAKIGNYAFSNCSALTTLGTIPSSVNEIGNSAFSGCTSLTSVTFTDNSNLATIGESAFASCPITRIAIPDNVSQIGNYAFQNCSSLVSVSFTERSNLTSIGNYAFQNCSKLEKLYTGSEPSAKSLTLPSSVTTIGGYAFQNCSALEAITVPENVGTLGAYAFSGCTSVNTINYYAANCNPSSTTTTSPFANGGSGITVNIGRTGGTKITSIPSYLFRGTNITNVNFNNVDFTITGFGTNVFYDCSALTSVDFAGNCSIVKIPSHTFDGCTALSDITIPEGVVSIGEYAFYSCPSLYKINLPVSLGTAEGETAIGDNAFGGSTRVLEIQNLSDLELTKGQSGNGNIAFYAVNIYSTGSGNLENVNGFIFMKGSTNYLVRYAGTETVLTLPKYENSYSYEISNSAFMGNTNITEVTVPAGVTRLGDSVFNGCTSLVTVALPASVYEMGSSVFSGCTSLTSVTLPNVSNLGDNLFDGCTSLETIEIPALVSTIGNSAFKGCTALKTVTFRGNSLRNVGTSAFQNCTSLTVIELPTPSTGNVALGGSAFAGCTQLSTVYLPAALTSYATTYFSNCAPNLILIATDKQSYETYKSSALYPTYNVTYVIEIQLIYGEHNGTALKLFGSEYVNYDISSDKSWLYNSNSSLPVQEGYSKSVWYSDEGLTEPISKVDFTSYLADPDWDAVMYANVLTLPEVTASKDLVYGDNGSVNGFTASAIFGDAFDTDKFTYTIVSYNLVSGAASATPAAVKDAGTYRLQIQIKDEDVYGQWLFNEEDLIRLFVSPSNYSLSDYWVTKSGASLLPNDEIVNLYLYGDNPQLERISENDGAVVERVFASYLLYSGSSSELSWNDPNGNKPYTVVSYSGDVQATSVGRYTVSVTLQANNNYALTLATDSYMMARGVSLTPGADSTYMVTKEWYIVTDGSISLITSNNTPYTISDWTYLLEANETIPTAPRYNNNNSSDTTAYSLYYTLMWNESDASSVGQPIFTNKRLTEAEFGMYFNSSMPAGNYSLDVAVSDGTANAYTQTFNFTVKPANLSKILTMKGVGGRVDGWTENNTAKFLANSSFIVADNGQLHLDDGTPDIYILSLSLSDINPREGYWALSDYASFYSKCVITYNVTRITGNTSQNTTNYYTEQELINSSVVPNTMGRYVIYYNITASNFKPLADVSDPNERSSFSYNLSIYGELKLPTVPSKEYTGSAVYFVDDITDWYYTNGYYQVIRLDGLSSVSITAVKNTGMSDEYIEAGTHYLALLIQPTYTDICRWAEGIRFDQSGTYALMPVTIVPAKNSVITDLSIISWQWGSWNEEINSPNWKTRFGTNYTYELHNLDTGKTVMFSSAATVDAGNYELIATASAGKNWEAISQKVTFVILKATISWEETPYIESWKYGDFDSMFNLVEGKLNVDFEMLEVDMRYYTLEQFESDNRPNNAPSTINPLLDEIGELGAGSYVLAYTVKGNSANYNDWEYEVHFSVLKSDNYWTTSPVVQSWRYGEFAERGVDPTVVPRFSGEITYSYVKLRADGSPDSRPYSSLKELLIGIEGEEGKELPVGRYSLTVTVTGTANYEMREPTVVTFEVMKGDNSWINIPSIISWSESRYSSSNNYPTSQAAFGEAVYTILEMDSEGNVINEYDISQIRSLGVGSYTLKAYVEGNDNYGDLTAYATFAVFEDSIGMTGLIAATMVFAVIALGLAVGGVILLVRRNKKIEEDFRKMVKSELHRR